MTITLIAKDDFLIDEIADHLTRQGVEGISLAKISEILYEGKTVDRDDLVILVAATQETLDAGEAASQIRQRLGVEQKLVLCMLRPNLPQTLLDIGVSEIICSAGVAVERFVERILGHLIREKHVRPYAFDALRGATWQMRKLYYDIEQYASLKDPVLILGETGTGKRLIADALHNKARGKGKLVPINCAAIDRELLADELFGHVKGAFTTGNYDRKGMIEEAEGGTAFIDEIGDLDATSQIKLLDVVETNRVRRAGANHFKEMNTRFVFATHRNLEERIREGLFREDFYARINMLVLEVPPLRERLADIPLLVEHFVKVFNQKYETSVQVQAGAVDELFRYDWPRNVRELEAVVRRAAARVGTAGLVTDIVLRESIRDPREFQSGHAKANQQRNLIVVDPEVAPWHEVRDKTEAMYFRLLTEVAKNEAHALTLCGMKRARLYEILGQYKLKLRR